MDTPAYVLDTPVVLALLRGRERGKHIANEFLDESSYAPIVPAVVVAELWATALSHDWTKRNWKALEELLAQFDVTDIEDEEIAAFAIVKAAMKARNRRMSDHDLWVAATAHVYDAVVLTSDTDFEDVPPDFCQRIILSLQAK